MKKYMNVAGRFHKVSESPVVIGLIGNVAAKNLRNEQIEYIKGFYGVNGKPHEITDFYPVDINQSMYNDFIIIKE